MHAARSRSATDGRHRLLVVGGEPHEAAAVAAQLDDFAHVEIVASGMAALAHMRRSAPDLVVLDAETSGMSGYDVLDAMHASRDLACVPVVLLTEARSSGFELRSLERGAIDAIAKPVRGSVLRTRVRTHLRVRTLSRTLRTMASIDAVTRLANRRTFFRVLHDEHHACVRAQMALHLIAIEIDDFASLRVNRDACLREVSRVLRASVQSEDRAARIGDGRLAVLLPGVTSRAAAQVARRISLGVRALKIAHGSGVVSVSVAIGHLGPARTLVHASPGAVRPATSLVDGTERALDEAKKTGPGQIWFYDVGTLARHVFRTAEPTSNA